MEHLTNAPPILIGRKGWSAPVVTPRKRSRKHSDGPWRRGFPLPRSIEGIGGVS
jgi:hypothetical protein